MLRLAGLIKRFGPTVAVRNVSLDIAPGQMVGIMKKLLPLPKSPFPRPSSQGTPEALSSPILRRLSSTSASRAARRGKRCERGVAAGGGVRPGGGAKRAFVLPIRVAIIGRAADLRMRPSITACF